jgi:hypothetical protein
MLPLAVIITTLPADTGLVATLRTIRAAADEGRAPAEILIADAGAWADDIAFAEALGARVLAAPGLARGAQLVQAAAIGAQPWLLFLPAGTRLGAGWAAEAAAFIADPLATGRAAYFRLGLDDPAPAARRLERIAAWRARRGLPGSAQGLLLARGLYEKLGGFRALPVLEDVDLARRIGRHRLVGFETEALASAAPYRSGFWLARPALNAAMLMLWFLGVPPTRLHRLRD